MSYSNLHNNKITPANLGELNGRGVRELTESPARML